MEPTRNRLVRRLLRVALLLVPVTYLGLLFSTLVHEVAGHAFAAILLGGHVDRITIYWDGFGQAAAHLPLDAPDSHQLMLFLSGAIATTTVGALLLAPAFAPRLNVYVRLASLILAGCCLLEGPPYAFWNALVPAPPGDMYYVLVYGGRTLGDSVWALRWGLILGGGATTVLATILLVQRSFSMVLGLLAPDRSIQHRVAIGLLLMIVAVITGAWTLFDWDQLVPGLGRLPGLCGSAVAAAAAILVYRSWQAREFRGTEPCPL